MVTKHTPAPAGMGSLLTSGHKNRYSLPNCKKNIITSGPFSVMAGNLYDTRSNIGATKASVLGVFEPITAILVGTLVFGEELTANIITGILISIVAVTFMIMVTKR